MISLLAALAIGLPPQQIDIPVPQDTSQLTRMIDILEPGGKPVRLSIMIPGKRLDPPKLSPKLFGDPPIKWEFDWITVAFGPDGTPPDPKTGEEQGKPQFRVFSQERRADNDKAPMVARQAIRMWDLLGKKLAMGHNPAINGGVVDYYLCWGGKAGGEQTLGQDVTADNRVITVNTIYLYDLRSQSTAVEMARVVAHEYGHAVLFPIGGYTAPEYWANGYLGEKLFLKWLRDAMLQGTHSADDAMGASLKDLNQWVKVNVDRLVVNTASSPPTQKTLEDKGPVGMDAYFGLVLYAEALFPTKVLARSMKLTGSQNAKDYPDALLMAMQEHPKITLSIPAYLKDKPFWIPLGEGKVAQASVLQRKGDWVQIKPQTGAVVITTARGSAR